ncbi:oxidoreductase [Colletotrichum truncatum]|uniref:Oxidoreductase n=1 Tax=Colletotrichum truncatum TaxID=5467 RepID=A0ACC3ZD90_COLTU|nr:oxidoreductase [Colletotrichum truncatum]KAF6797836.1 oxidoreductase [Colletotrichum truncatum]
MNYSLLLTSLFASHILPQDSLFSSAFTTKMPVLTAEWHEGEIAVHELLKVPLQRYPTAAGLPASYGYRVAAAPLLALGTLDGDGRPWTTLWGGDAGAVARPVAEDVLGVRSKVDVVDDPVIRALWGGEEREIKEGEVVQPGPGGEGKTVSGLAIDLRTRDRVKIAGKMIAGAVTTVDGNGGGELQIAVKVDESLGNCPKYLNKKDVREREAVVKGKVERGLPLSDNAIAAVGQADMLFLSSSYGETMDTNHRGGSKGFVRVIRNDDDGVEIIYPEFSGNRLYQTLGNLKANPKVGVAIPDFDTSDVLYLTGTASILVGQEAAAYLPRTKLAIKITVTSAVFVQSGLPFVGAPLEPSPYNPPVRHLFTEQTQPGASSAGAAGTATLINREIITPTIARFTFGLEPAGRWEPGQYVTLDFAPELDVGWSHMRDDEPQSLNDDFVRTFTISNTFGGGQKLEITARKKGPATGFLWRWNLRVPLEVPVLGFGGEEAFRMGKSAGDEVFVAAGVGITPLMAQAEGVINSGTGLKVLWSVKGEDLKFVKEVLDRIDGLAKLTRVFVTGRVGETEDALIKDAEALGAAVERRRIEEGDVKGTGKKYFLCTGPAMLKTLNGWLEGEDVAWEDFAY